MKNQFAFCFLIFSANFCFAQTFSVQFGATYPRIPSIESAFDFEFESTSLDFASLPDTVFLKQRINSSGTSVQKFEVKNIGIEGGLNLQWSLKKNIGIATGIHAKAYSFNRSFETTNNFFERTIIDTVSALENPPINFGPTCDRFLNNTGALVANDLIDKYEIIDLYLPLKMTYSIWDGEIAFFAGGYFSVPIYSKHTLEFFRIESEEINNETVCEFVRHIRKTDSSNEFTRINYGILFGIDYQLSRRFSVSLSADQRFTKMLSYNNIITAQPEPSLESQNTKLSFISATARFTINPPKRIQTTDNQ